MDSDKVVGIAGLFLMGMVVVPIVAICIIAFAGMNS
jgi:hypothetical protein